MFFSFKNMYMTEIQDDATSARQIWTYFMQNSMQIQKKVWSPNIAQFLRDVDAYKTPGIDVYLCGRQALKG